jgi:hypothetical protein
MAIVFTDQNTPEINSTANQTSYSSASWTPPNELIIAIVHSGKIPAGVQPTGSGNGITWTAINTIATGNHRLTLFGANGSGATAGATTFDFGAETQAECAVSFISASGTDVANGVAQTFVQSPTNSVIGATSLSITLAAAGNSNNRPVAGFSATAAPRTPRTSWTETIDVPLDVSGLEAQYRSDAFETTASASTAGAENWIGIASEIKAQTVSAAQPPRHTLLTLGAG